MCVYIHKSCSRSEIEEKSQQLLHTALLYFKSVHHQFTGLKMNTSYYIIRGTADDDVDDGGAQGIFADLFPY